MSERNQARRGLLQQATGLGRNLPLRLFGSRPGDRCSRRRSAISSAMGEKKKGYDEQDQVRGFGHGTVDPKLI